MRQGRMNFRISAIIICYCMLVTGAFFIGIAQFRSTMEATDINSFMKDTGSLEAYRMTEEEYMMLDPSLLEVQTDRLERQRIADLNSYRDYYDEQMRQKLLRITVFFSIFLLLTSFLLWRMLTHLQHREKLRIASQLEDLKNKETLLQNDPVLMQAYASIREEYERHLEDYKRLQSYLSHEQKNAIALLKTNMELHKEEECRRNIDAITDSIDDILTISANTSQDTLAIVDVSLIAAEVCDAYAGVHADIQFHFHENDNTLILAKERWIYRAVSNLLDNAVKYGNGKPIDVEVQEKHHSVVIQVKDRGIGIDEEQQEKIFDHRYRISELHADGYGIGLSLVSHVCELCSGSIFIESQLQEGTSFYLSFPQYQPE